MNFNGIQMWFTTVRDINRKKREYRVFDEDCGDGVLDDLYDNLKGL